MTAPPEEGTAAPDDLASRGLTVTLTRSRDAHRPPGLMVAGFVDILTVGEFERAVDEATTGRNVVLDLTRAEFVSGAAIAVLFEQRDHFDAVLVAAGSIVDVALDAARFPTTSCLAPPLRP